MFPVSGNLLPSRLESDPRRIHCLGLSPPTTLPVWHTHVPLSAVFPPFFWAKATKTRREAQGSPMGWGCRTRNHLLLQTSSAAMPWGGWEGCCPQPHLPGNPVPSRIAPAPIRIRGSQPAPDAGITAGARLGPTPAPTAALNNSWLALPGSREPPFLRLQSNKPISFCSLKRGGSRGVEAPGLLYSE